MNRGAVFSLPVTGHIQAAPDGEPLLIITANEHCVPTERIATGTVNVTIRNPFICVDNQDSRHLTSFFNSFKHYAVADEGQQGDQSQESNQPQQGDPPQEGDQQQAAAAADGKKPREKLPSLFTNIDCRYAVFRHEHVPEENIRNALADFQYERPESINGYKMGIERVVPSVPDFHALFVAELQANIEENVRRDNDATPLQRNFHTGPEIHVTLLGNSDNLADRRRVLEDIVGYLETYRTVGRINSKAVSLTATGFPEFAKQ